MFRKAKPREQRTFCYCDRCHNELISSESFFEDTDLVRYVCSNCGLMSEFMFDAPVPLLVRTYDVAALRPEDV